ncbi:MAG: transaldolase [Actinomycetota bacterium]
MSKLQDLYADQGQSPWLDNLRRGWITGGEMQELIEQGIRGITSNPTIFQKAITGEDTYDRQFADLVGGGATIEDAYWSMVVRDIESALALLRPVYDASDGRDGYVSVEVAPELANDTEATTEQARELHTRIDEPNVMIKIPGTEAGLPAIEQMIAEKRSINVTLIFGLDRYQDVMEAYLRGLERADGDLSRVASVASFFISRVDTEVNRRLDEIGTPEALALKGKTAVANGQLAYQLFEQTFSGPRWEALVERGARVQRPLWASTSTKDPSYPETLYVDTLIGPETVNTMPDATVDAFVAGGTVARTVDADYPAAQSVIDQVSALGVDLDEVVQLLEDQGVASFSKSFDELLAALDDKRDRLS